MLNYTPGKPGEERAAGRAEPRAVQAGTPARTALPAARVHNSEEFSPGFAFVAFRSEH